MIWPFKRKPQTALDLLKSTKIRCSNCEKPHRGMFDLACDAPDVWLASTDARPNSDIRQDSDFLGQDFCVLAGEHFMVRCVLEIPVHGLKKPFAFGCWGSLKQENFQTYLDHFDDSYVHEEVPWWSWLCNQLMPFAGEESVGCWMHPRPGRMRPLLIMAVEDHPLAIAQQDGISPEDLLEIYRAHGHEIVP